MRAFSVLGRFPVQWTAHLGVKCTWKWFSFLALIHAAEVESWPKVYFLHHFALSSLPTAKPEPMAPVAAQVILGFELETVAFFLTYNLCALLPLSVVPFSCSRLVGKTIMLIQCGQFYWSSMDWDLKSKPNCQTCSFFCVFHKGVPAQRMFQGGQDRNRTLVGGRCSEFLTSNTLLSLTMPQP